MSSPPIYPGWGSVPADLRPEADLRYAGLEPRGEPVAYVVVGDRQVALYREADAVARHREAADEPARGSVDPSRASLPIGSAGSTGGRASRRVAVPLPGRPGGAAPRAATGPDAGSALAWVRALLLDDFVVLDTETTGLGYRDEVIEIGIVDPGGSVVLSSLVRPQSGTVPAAATRVHGLSMRDLADAPTWEELHDEVVAATRGRRVIAWNASFDERMVRQSASRWRRRERITGFECAMVAYARARGLRYGRAKLERAAQELGLLGAAAQRHRSSDDALLTLQVLMKVAGAER